jgi:GLPGLI family protein
MKNKLFIAISLLSTVIISAQNFQGKAIYKTSKKSSFKIGDDKDSNMSDIMKAQIQARIRKLNQKTFILNFDKFTSIYKEEAKLAAPKPQVGGPKVMVMSFGGSRKGSVYYKNLQDKRFVNQTEIMGKVFLIKDSLPNFNWQLSSETKNIGKYTCYKATFSKEIEIIKMIVENGETKEEKKKETITTTAWYTPQIPISNGPDDFQGLPGLILEINDGTITIVCTEIIIDSKKKIEIEEPKKGKVVSQVKFQKISKEKSREMMEKFKSRKGVDMGNGINIKMGG